MVSTSLPRFFQQERQADLSLFGSKAFLAESNEWAQRTADFVWTEGVGIGQRPFLDNGWLK